MTVFGEGDATALSDRLLMHWKTHAKKDLGIDLLEEIPVLKKAFPAAGEYLFPDGMLIGFGDTHPSGIPKEVLDYAKPKTSPFFYAPDRILVRRTSGKMEVVEIK